MREGVVWLFVFLAPTSVASQLDACTVTSVFPWSGAGDVRGVLGPPGKDAAHFDLK
jgi:hypothetical protein